MPPKAVAKMREELTKDLDENHFGVSSSLLSFITLNSSNEN